MKTRRAVHGKQRAATRAAENAMRRKPLIDALPPLDPSAARPLARLEERGAIGYPSLAALSIETLSVLSIETLSALLDDAMRAVRRPAMAGAVGFAVMASACTETQDAMPAATLVPLGATQDTSAGEKLNDLTLVGVGGWGSLAASAGGRGPASTGGSGGASGSGSAGGSGSEGGSGTGADPTHAPCDPGFGSPVDGGVADAGVDAGRRHVVPNHNTPQLRGRMPSIRPMRTVGVAPPVTPTSSGSTP